MVSNDPTDEVEQAIPDGLGLVRDFVNTWEGELGTDTGTEELDSPEALEAWMRGRGLEVGTGMDGDDLRRAIRFREALRHMLVANSGAELDPTTVEVVRRAAHEAPLQVRVDAAGEARAEPAEDGVRALFAQTLAAIARAQATGTWTRLKACTADDCQWAFYDHSRNRSRTWCSMEVCGNRAKTRSYRARRGGRPG
jgi:predicted RNA-binding Zn ribbon-like protein